MDPSAALETLRDRERHEDKDGGDDREAAHQEERNRAVWGHCSLQRREKGGNPSLFAIKPTDRLA